MLSAIDNFKETLKGPEGNPDRFVNEWECFEMIPDPLMTVTLVARPGEEVVDPWGVHIIFDEATMGAMPHVTPETVVCPDVTEWRDYVKVPDLDELLKDAKMTWEDTNAIAEAAKAKGKMPMTLMATGLFEMSHYLLGFEEALIAALAEPEDYYDMVEAIFDYKMKYLDILFANSKPEVILFHDDWGSKQNLFLPPDIWRDHFKEFYRKIYAKIHENGAIVLHHSDSFCEQIVSDMVEIGMDVWQGPLPENDIPKLQAETAGKLIYMGGIDASIVDTGVCPEDEIRAEVARACREYAPGGAFIPCLTYGGEGSIYPGVNDILMDEIAKQSPLYFK